MSKARILELIDEMRKPVVVSPCILTKIKVMADQIDRLRKVKFNPSGLAYQCPVRLIGTEYYVCLGYIGPFVIDGIYDSLGKRFKIVNPIKFDASVGALYTGDGRFYGWNYWPRVGCHFIHSFQTRDGSFDSRLCLGGLELPEPTTVDEVKESSRKIVSLMRNINLSSLGNFSNSLELPEYKAIMQSEHLSLKSMETLIKDGLIVRESGASAFFKKKEEEEK